MPNERSNQAATSHAMAKLRHDEPQASGIFQKCLHFIKTRSYFGQWHPNFGLFEHIKWNLQDNVILKVNMYSHLTVSSDKVRAHGLATEDKDVSGEIHKCYWSYLSKETGKNEEKLYFPKI